MDKKHNQSDERQVWHGKPKQVTQVHRTGGSKERQAEMKQ